MLLVYVVIVGFASWFIRHASSPAYQNALPMSGEAGLVEVDVVGESGE